MIPELSRNMGLESTRTFKSLVEFCQVGRDGLYPWENTLSSRSRRQSSPNSRVGSILISPLPKVLIDGLNEGLTGLGEGIHDECGWKCHAIPTS